MSVTGDTTPPVPEMSVTDLGIASYVERLEEQRCAAASVAGNVAVVRLLQDQVWEKHAEEVILPGQQTYYETCALLAEQPRACLFAHRGSEHQGVIGIWRFQANRNLEGKDFTLDTTIQMDVHSPKKVVPDLLSAANMLSMPGSWQRNPGAIFGVEPERVKRHGIGGIPGFKRYRFSDIDTIKNRAIELLTASPDRIYAATTINELNGDYTTWLHYADWIDVDWVDPGVRFDFFKAENAEAALDKVKSAELHKIFDWLKEKIEVESHAKPLAALQAINVIIGESNAIIPA